MSEPVRVHLDPDYVYTYSALSVFWPESEFHALIARWPQLADHLGASWDEHRRPSNGAVRSAKEADFELSCCPPTYPASRRSRRPLRHVSGEGRPARPSGPAQRHHRHAGLAARPDGSVLVRVGAQVQAVLSAARTRRTGLRFDDRDGPAHGPRRRTQRSVVRCAAVGRKAGTGTVRPMPESDCAATVDDH